VPATDGRLSTPSRRTGYWRWSATCAQPTAMPPTADSRFLSISLAGRGGDAIPGEPFLWDGALPGTPRVRAAEAIHRARPAQQPIEQSPVDALKLRAAQRGHRTPSRLRRAGGHRLADSADVASPRRTPLLTTHRLPTRTGQRQSPHGRQPPRPVDRQDCASRAALPWPAESDPASNDPRLAAPMSPSGFRASPKGARRPSPAIRSDFSDRGSTADCGPFATHSN